MGYIAKLNTGKFLGFCTPIESFVVVPSDEMTYFYDRANRLVAAIKTKCVDYVVNEENASELLIEEEPAHE